MNGLEAVWEQPVMRALGGALAGFVWQGAAIALAVQALLACMGRRPARERYALACAGLLMMVLLPVISFGTALAAPVSQGPRFLGDEVLLMNVSLATRTSAWLVVLRPWLMSAWLCGVLLLSLRTVWAWRRALALTQEGTRQPASRMALAALTRMMKRARVSRPVRLLESVAIEVPTVVGLWRPLILLPASTLSGLSVLQLEAILAHELAHIRRHDYLVNLLQALVETVLFYHPAVWWLSARIREEREHCADDVAVECCGDVLLYSRALATLEQLRGSIPAPALAANGGSLLLRIQRLLHAPQGGAPLPPWRLAGSLAAVLLIGVLGAARQAQAIGEGSKPAEVPRFHEGMTRPMRISGDIPRIPESMYPLPVPPGEDMLRMSVECILPVEGIPTGCTVVDPIVPKQELAPLVAEVLRTLNGSRFKPATFQGQPIAVWYVFQIRISAPGP